MGLGSRQPSLPGEARRNTAAHRPPLPFLPVLTHKAEALVCGQVLREELGVDGLLHAVVQVAVAPEKGSGAQERGTGQGARGEGQGESGARGERRVGLAVERRGWGAEAQAGRSAAKLKRQGARLQGSTREGAPPRKADGKRTRRYRSPSYRQPLMRLLRAPLPPSRLEKARTGTRERANSGKGLWFPCASLTWS